VKKSIAGYSYVLTLDGGALSNNGGSSPKFLGEPK